MKNIKQTLISMLKRISSTTKTQRYFVGGVVFLLGVGVLILVALATYNLPTVGQTSGGETTKNLKS